MTWSSAMNLDMWDVIKKQASYCSIFYQEDQEIKLRLSLQISLLIDGGEVIKDKVLVSVLVDRITFKAHLVNMTGTSYRLKETKKRNENKTKR